MDDEMKMTAHSNVLLLKCAMFREEGLFTDVQLRIGRTVFSAHRMVLAAYSSYFYAMFTNGMKESNQEVIELKDESISSDALKIVMDSIYTGDLVVNKENVFEVLAAADHLQVTSVVQQCCDYLLTEFVELHFDVETYCRIWTVADRHSLKDLQEAAEHKMALMYKDVCESEEFLSHISAEQFLSLLSRDDLSVPSETFVFESVMQWIKHKKKERMALAAKVIGAVRLKLVDITVMIKQLSTEEMQGVPELHMHLHESMIHNCMSSNSSTFPVWKVEPRSMSTVRPIGAVENPPAKSKSRRKGVQKRVAANRVENGRMEDRSEEELLGVLPPSPQKQPPNQGLFPVRGIHPFWNRPSPGPVPIPVPGGPQPWIFVQYQPEQQHEQGPPPEVPAQAPILPVQTRQPSAPAAEPEIPQCPVCKALMPPGVNRDEHVNGHFE